MNPKTRSNAGDNSNINPVFGKIAQSAAAIKSRANVVGRELRDIPTEIGTAAKYKSGKVTDGPKGNVGKQIKDVGKALTTGKAGSTPSVIAKSQSKDKYPTPRGAGKAQKKK